VATPAVSILIFTAARHAVLERNPATRRCPKIKLSPSRCALQVSRAGKRVGSGNKTVRILRDQQRLLVALAANSDC
jgi:hypothetical protein